MNALLKTYAPLPISFSYGKGYWLYNEKGEKYLDALSGIGVSSLGHSHPKLIKALQQQVEQLLHTSNYYRIEKSEQLAEKLTNACNMDAVFFSNSGTEANETAIKITRLYAHQRNIKNPVIISAENSFHGRTFGSLSATGNVKIKQGFSPLLSGFETVPFGEFSAIEALSDRPEIVAVMLEPIQGEGGVVIPKTGYLKAVEELCQRNNWLFLMDEIQSGTGRTGKLLAHWHDSTSADITTLAKGLGAGIPIGATLVKKRLIELVNPGSHGTTFGGNPLAATAALTVLETLESEGLIFNAQQIGGEIRQLLKDKILPLPQITDIRNKGLMIGISVEGDASTLPRKALNEGLLINVTQNSIRLLPPLIIDSAGIETLVQKLHKTLTL